MRMRKIVGIIFVILGFGILFVFSRETPGIIASTVFIVLGLIMTFMNRRGII